MNNKGFSYIEILIVAIIFAVISIAALGLYLTYFMVVNNATESAIALNDTQQVVERIRDVDPFTNTNLISFVGNSGNYTFNNLTNEQVNIAYDVSSDPFLIVVTTTWLGMSNRQQSVALTTYMTQR